MTVTMTVDTKAIVAGLPTETTGAALPPPFIPLPNIQNFRGVGLVPLPNYGSNKDSAPQGASHFLKPGILFRSADPYSADPHELSRLGIKTVYDLRSLPELAKGLGWAEGQAVDPDEIARIWAPVFAAEDYSPEKLAVRVAYYMSESVTGFVQAYQGILAQAGPSYKLILQNLASPNPSGVLVHCTAGKDRTGIFFGLLLQLLGADRQSIADEYNLTEIGLGEVKKTFIKNVVDRLRAQAAAGSPAAPKGLPDSEQEREEKWLRMAARLIGASKESMLAALDMIQETYGGPEAYVKSVCELDDDTINAIKKNLVITTDEAKAISNHA